MRVRSFSPPVICIVAAILLSPAMAQDVLEANGVVDLASDAAILVDESQDTSALPAAETPLAPSDGVATPESMPEQSGIGPSFQPPAHEQRRLGQAKHAPTKLVEEAEPEASLFERLNPQQYDFIRVSGALAVVVGLLFGLRFIAKRLGQGVAGGSRPSGVLEVLAKYPVGRGQYLILLKVARRVVLLHQSGSSMATLSEMSDSEEVAALLARMEAGSRSKDADRFRKTLAEFTDGSKNQQHPSRAALPKGDAEIVDLTRAGNGVFSRWWGKVK